METDTITQTAEQNRQWQSGLRQFLYSQILLRLEPNKENRIKLVDSQAMSVWSIAFTHKSYNPNVGHNYEELEKLGDSVMKNGYIKFLILTYKGITNSQISELVNHYLSKDEQGILSKKLGLDKWVRRSVNITLDISEDILESFFGALDLIADRALTFGAGYLLSFNMILSLYKDIVINKNIFKGHPKSQVKQIFDKMQWGEVREEWQKNEDGFSGTLTLLFTKFALTDLQERGLNIRSPVIATEEGPSLKNVKRRIYLKALDYLASLGITEEWANIQKEQKIYEDPELAPYYPGAQARLTSEGYIDMYFKLPQIGGGGCFAQLIGVKADGSTKVIASVSDCTIRGAKVAVLQQYANGM